MTRRQWLDHATRALRGGEAPRREAGLLLCRVLELTDMALITHPDENVPPRAVEALNALLARRLAGEPMAYLLGRREFYGRGFDVSPATLIPRPDTECLVDEALARLPEHGVRFADLGTGSGCVAVTLAAERPCWRGVAVDISPEALEVARRNAVHLGVADRLTLVRADFCASSFSSLVGAEFPACTSGMPVTERGEETAGSPALQLVISNPPYISEAEYGELDAGVREFEPKQALTPGPTGLEHAIAVVKAASALLELGGLLIMEHGCGQGAATRALCPADSWTAVQTGKDLAGRDRFLLATRAGDVSGDRVAHQCG